jgi:putative hydrolase of the HAD superfamily
LTLFDAVIFDWGGTLTPWHPIDTLACWRSVTADPALAQRLAEAENAVWARCRDEHVSASVADIIDAAGCALSTAEIRAYYDWWDAHTFTDPQALPMLEQLRGRGLKIGVLSNTVWPRLEHERIFHRDGIHHLIDGAVYSSEIARTKPHQAAFQAAMDSVGAADPGRVVFVGDRLFDDIWGAQQAGMVTVHVPHSDIPAWQTTGVYGTPDAVIGSLADLPAILDDWETAGSVTGPPGPGQGRVRSDLPG